MSANRIILLITFVSFLIGCAQDKFESETEVWNYVRDANNGLIQTAEIGNYSLSVYYKPKSLLILQELNNNVSKPELSELQSKYSNYDYFVVEYSQSDGTPMYDQQKTNYSDLLRSIAYRFQNYAFITAQKNSQVLPVDFSYFPTYNLRDKLELLLIFNNEEYQAQNSINFHVREIGFGIGDQRFEFDLEKIKSIPEFNWKVNQSKN